MSTFSSPVEAIAKLTIHSFPKRSAVRDVAKVGCRGKTVVAVDARGVIYSNVASRFHYVLGINSRYEDMFMLLRDMRVLTAQQVKLHLRACEERSEKWARESNAGDLRTVLKAAGLRPTKAQQAYIDAHAPKEKTP